MLVSNSPNDVNVWVHKVINSCISHKQVLSARKLVKAFKKLYPSNRMFDAMFFTHLYLDDHCNQKFNELILKEIKDDNNSKSL